MEIKTMFVSMVTAGPAGTSSAEKIDDSAPRMTRDDFKSRLMDPSFTAVDVRQPHDWDGSSMKIKGAVREDPSEVETWASKYAEYETLGLYCA